MRKLSTILIMDIAGYSNKSSFNEVGTHQLIKEFTENILKPALTKFQGKLVKATKDGWIIYFANTFICTDFAFSVKERISTQTLDIRFGIHIGDVVYENNDVLGATINIAASLDKISAVNQVTLSSAAYLSLEDQQKEKFIDKGFINLKGINKPIQVFSTGDIDAESSNSGDVDYDPKSKLIIGKLTTGESISNTGNIGDKLHSKLFEYLSEKSWVKATINKQARANDYQLRMSAEAVSGQIQFTFKLFHPQKDIIWEDVFAFRANNIMINDLSEEVTEQVVMKLMKYKSDF